MLVSTAVLVLLVVMVGQLLSSATMTTGLGRKRIDSDTEARLVFDRLAEDFDKMLNRPDVDYLFYQVDSNTNPGTPISSGTNNDSMYFYSEVPAFFDTGASAGSQSSVSLIGYRINYANPYYPGHPVLERLCKGLTWGGLTSGTGAPGSVLFLTSTGGGITIKNTWLSSNWGLTIDGAGGSVGNGADPDYHVLSDRVFRMEFAYLLKDGTISMIPLINPKISPPGAQVSGTSSVSPFTVNASSGNGGQPAWNDAAPTYAVGSRWYDSSDNTSFICTSASNVNGSGQPTAMWNNAGMQDVSAIIVAIAVLDETSAKLVTPAKYPILAGSLPELMQAETTNAAPKPLMSGTNLPSALWTNVLTSSTFSASVGIPKIAAQQIHVYQRYFYLNNP
jgi:hypothetical protein